MSFNSMLRLRPAQVTPHLRGLFDPGMPAGLRCFAVLDGRAAGLILADDPSNPTWGAVQEAGSGTVYFGGALDTPISGGVIASLRQSGDVLVGMWPGDERLAVLPPDPDYDGFTLDFTGRSVDEECWRDLTRIPPGCEVRRMDRALFARCADRDYYTTVFGDVDRTLAQGIGYCLLRNDEIVSEAFAGPDALGMIEIATGTHEAHRRRGYATATCAHLIDACEAQGLRTYWNCAKQNVASAGLARKLGYRSEREYRLLAWFRLQNGQGLV